MTKEEIEFFNTGIYPQLIGLVNRINNTKVILELDRISDNIKERITQDYRRTSSTSSVLYDIIRYYEDSISRNFNGIDIVVNGI